VYFFGSGSADGNHSMRDTLGRKGANLAEMTDAGLPVPPGFTISTDVCNIYYKLKQRIPASIDAEICQNLKKLERIAGKTLGASNNPLIVSVRPGAKFSMPGMMDTILNLGLNDSSVEGLKARTSNGRFAFDSYRRFIQMFGNVVLEIPREAFEQQFEAVKRANGAAADTDLEEAALRDLVERFKRLVRDSARREFPQDPHEQLMMSRDSVFRSWMSPRAQAFRRIYDISDHIGTAVNVQMMVFGNTGNRSATGVAFTRNPATGANELCGEFLTNAQGEDVIAGLRTPRPVHELEKLLPNAYSKLRETATRLEKHYNDMQDFEFTIQDEAFWLTQSRSAKRTGVANLRTAIDMLDQGLIAERDVISRLSPEHLLQVFTPRVPAETARPNAFALGLPASPGVAVGNIVTNPQGGPIDNAEPDVVLTVPDVSPDLIHAAFAAKALITTRGGMMSHGAVVARSLGKPCVIAQGLEVQRDGLRGTDRLLGNGAVITVDGTTGRIYEGALPLEFPTIDGDEYLKRFAQLVASANPDQFVGRLGLLWALRDRLRSHANVGGPAARVFERLSDAGKPASRVSRTRRQYVTFVHPSQSSLREILGHLHWQANKDDNVEYVIGGYLHYLIRTLQEAVGIGNHW